MQVRENKVKQILNSGGTIFSSSVRLPEPGLCEILGYAGFDFVLLDGEHGAVDNSSIDRMTQSCFAADTVPVVPLLPRNKSNQWPRSIFRRAAIGWTMRLRAIDDNHRRRCAVAVADDGSISNPEPFGC